MLIQSKSLDSGSVLTFKLIGGDEVIARLKEDYVPGQDAVVSKPLLVMMGHEQFGMMPFVLTVDPDQTITISASSIIFAGKTLKQVADVYTQQTSGLLNMGG